MDSITFSTDIAVTAAHVAAVLVVAFVVEARSLGQKREFSGTDARWLVLYVFAALVLVLATTAVLLNGPPMITGIPAIWAWGLIGAGMLGLISLVAIAAWAGINAASEDGVKDRARTEALKDYLERPGWRWLLSGVRQPALDSEQDEPKGPDRRH